MPVMKLRLSRRHPGNATHRLEQVVLAVEAWFQAPLDWRGRCPGCL